MTEVREEKVKCPYCGKKMEYRELFFDLPYVGKAVIFSYYCPNCGYHSSDVALLEIKSGKRYTFKVKSDKDLYTKVVRSQSGKVTIPEVGLEMIPGNKAEMFITNIEGVISRFKKALDIARKWNLQEGDIEKVKKIDEIKEYLDKVLEGKEEMTLIVEDPFGNSAILSDKAKIEEVKEEYSGNRNKS